MGPVREVDAPTYEVLIFIAGPPDRCKDLLAEYAMRGACYSVERTEFVYTGGRETGSVIRLINYPRFPVASAEALTAAGAELGRWLIERMFQTSCTVQGPERTVWLTRRADP